MERSGMGTIPVDVGLSAFQTALLSIPFSGMCIAQECVFCVNSFSWDRFLSQFRGSEGFFDDFVVLSDVVPAVDLEVTSSVSAPSAGRASRDELVATISSSVKSLLGEE
eukprot:scaffold1434_cov630-Pavlova_lutheri.AAC.1